MTAESGNDSGGRRLVAVLCDCGENRTVGAYSLTSGRSTGCHRCGVKTHGHCMNGKLTPTYRIWAGMVERCTNASVECFKYYGGRGIRVCDEWVGESGFAAFLAHVGERPGRLEIDRVDTNGHYEPGNVRWTTRREQLRNTRRNVTLTAFGRTQCAADWAREVGLDDSTILYRIRHGMTPEQAIGTPSRQAVRT